MRDLRSTKTPVVSLLALLAFHGQAAVAHPAADPETIKPGAAAGKEVRGAETKAPAPANTRNPDTPGAHTAEGKPDPAAAAARKDVPLVKEQQILVTGSRIPRAEVEGPAAITVITAEEIEQQGYKNVFDALSGQTQNTGFTQGEDFGNTFTPAANTVSLRGLGPNHTLILVNGRRLADYPVAYEGSVNFVNLSNIPAALIDRVEILNGGASAIYGSDAIAGVINIVLKRETKGFDVDVRLGATQRGGGENGRVQLSGGLNRDRLHAIFGIELSHRQPIWSRQRDFMASTTAQGAAPTVVFGRRNVRTNRYLDPGAGVCERLGGLFESSTLRYQSSRGVYCGSGKANPLFWTTQTETDSKNFIGALRYELDGKTELFADLALGFTTVENNTRGPNWTSAASEGGYFYNRNSGAYEVWNRRIAPEEIGGVTRYNRHWDDASGNLALGIRGELGGTSWNYEAVYSYSGYYSERSTPVLTSHVDAFFLGPRLGTDAAGIAIYAPDPERLYRALTPEEFSRIVDRSRSKDRSWTQSLAVSANGDLFELPAGTVRLATIVETGSQGFGNKPDPRINEGRFYNSSGALTISGSRKRYALGAELSLPILKQLSGTLAGRHDRYEFGGRSDSKFTYNAGLEFRPTRQLLFRGNYATSFRAPDMNYIFSPETRGYYSSTTDYYRCQLAGQPLANCEYAGLSPGANFIKTGTANLKSESGQSYGYGAVWSPSASFDLSADFWKVNIDDLVTDLSADTILRDEADCRAGIKDINSPTCVDALARVRRNPPNAVMNPNVIREILVNPINAAKQTASGFDLAGKLRWKAAGFGNFSLGLKYTKVRTYIYKQFPADPAINQVGTLRYTDWPDKAIATLGWNVDRWSSALTVTRYGKIPDGSGKGWLTPYGLANLSVAYEIKKGASVSLTVNNLLNHVRQDNTGGWPFYPVGSYSPHGRQGWIGVRYHFG